MIQKALFAFLLFFILVWVKGKAESSDSVIFNKVMKHIHKSMEYENNADFANCFIEIDKAKEIALENEDEELHVRVVIFESEICRKTRDFQRGLDLLLSIPQSEKYPDHHIIALGRYAAIFNEGNFGLSDKEIIDTVKHYLENAINLALKINQRSNLASLYNELGYILSLSSPTDTSGRFYLRKAANLYLETEDTLNYIGCRINLMRSYFKNNQFEKLNQVIKSDFFEFATRKGISTTVQELYKIASKYYQSQGDSLNTKKWRYKTLYKKLEFVQDISSKQLDAYRIQYETEKYQLQAAEKEEELMHEEEAKQRLLIFLAILGFLILGVGFLLIRERKLKEAVNKANEKYHMLLVESNHRIKNNLQMVISMLQYASLGLQDRDSMAFKRMSGKIQTISALHKHLYLDVHNEKVDMNTFFKDIIKMYKEISSQPFTIHIHIDDVKIESERIVYFGLIFNEMLSNTIEHGNLENTIFISIQKVGTEFRFSYRDDANFTVNDTNIGTGTQLIKQLIDRVEGENFEMNNKIGSYTFSFHE